MSTTLQQRCSRLERSVRAMHDECERLMRENELLRKELTRYEAGQTQIQRVQYSMSRAEPEVIDSYGAVAFSWA